MMIGSCHCNCVAVFGLMSKKRYPVDRTLHYILIQDTCSKFVWKIKILAFGFVLHIPATRVLIVDSSLPGIDYVWITSEQLGR